MTRALVAVVALMAILLSVAPASASPVQADSSACTASADPLAPWGPRASASCALAGGKNCWVQLGPGPNDAPELKYGC